MAFVEVPSMKWLAYVVVAAGSGNLPKSRVEEGPVRGMVCVLNQEARKVFLSRKRFFEKRKVSKL